MEIAKRVTVKLTGKEYELLQDAIRLIGNIDLELNPDDLEKEYDLRGVEYTIAAFLEDSDVYVV